MSKKTLLTGPGRQSRAAAVFALIALALLAGGYWYYRVEAERIRRDRYQHLAAIGGLKAGQILHWRMELLADADRVAKDPFLIEAEAELLRNPGALSLRTDLRERLGLERMEDRDDLLLLDPKGNILLSAREDPDPVGPATMLAVEAAVAGRKAVLSDLYRCPSGLVHIDAAEPVLDAGGRLLAVLVLRSNAGAFLYPLIQSWPTSSRSAETLLVRREGEEVVYLNELRHQAETALSLRFPLSKSDNPAVQAVLGKRGLFQGKDYRGTKVLADLRPVDGSPWFLVTKVDAGELLAEARYRAGVIALFAVLAILLAAAVVAFVYRQRQAGIYRDLYRSERERREAQEQFRTTVYSIGDAVITTDRGGRVRQMNPAAEQLTGWSEAEARSKPLEEVFRIRNEETRAAVENPVERVLREGVVIGLANHTLLIARDGTERPIADSGAPIRDEKGAITGVVLVFRDQTEEREAQRALRESEERFRSLFENELSGVALHEILVDDRGKPVDYVIIQSNPAFEKHTGLRAADVLGKRATEVLSGFGATPIIEAYCKVALSGEPVVFEHSAVPLQRQFHISAYRVGPGRLASTFQDITSQKQTEAALIQERSLLRTVVDNLPDAIYAKDLEGRKTLSNRFDLEIVGLESDRQALGKTDFDLFPPEEAARLYAEDQAVLQTGQPMLDREELLSDAEGDRLWLLTSKLPIKDAEGRVVGLVGIGHNISQRKRAEEEREKLEAQLRQAQKMEAVGRLAGGVAHDFNNMLQVINSYAELVLTRLPPSDPLRAAIQEIAKAGLRSADLTRQLLAFARKQTVAPQILNLNTTITGMLKMLQRLIGEDIDLAWMPSHGLWKVTMDPAQIDQILANLTVNARDAIPGVGKITIETGNVVLDEAYCRAHVGFLPGEYVLLAVSDDGCGMDKETQARLFEPFFTTKPPGQGTGLGLATVYGIVKQNNGFINVYSEPGKGATFKIYLPRLESVEEGSDQVPERAEAPRGTETVLLVEDEEALLGLGQILLEALGYTALAAGSPSQAIRLAEEYAGDIHLLLTDVVMPGMSGRDLWQRLSALRPDMKCLFMSGYTANAIAHRGVLDEGVNFLQKPFSREALAAKLREALSER